MWVIQNYTPFAVAGGFVYDREGRLQWVVAVRATLEFSESGQLTRSAFQAPVSRVAAFHGPAATSSLLHDAELLLPKRFTDVILDAQAWAPGQRPVAELDVGFELGRIRKRLRVYGERTWVRHATQGIVPGTPKPFVTSPIKYEHAFGGQDKSGRSFLHNPVGRGYALSPEDLLHSLAPNIEDPSAPTMAARPPARAAGFGAVAAHWAERTRFAGTYDERWQRERAPLWPDDLDERFFQSAPSDQQVPGRLSGGEECLLLHLTRAGQARFRIPRIAIRVSTQFKQGVEHSDARLNTVFIQSQTQQLTIGWSAAHPCQDREHLLELSRVTWEGEKTWAEPQRQTSII